MKAIRNLSLVLLGLIATLTGALAQPLQSIYLFLPQSPTSMSLIDSFEYDSQSRLNKRLSFLVNPNGLAILAGSTAYSYNTDNQILSLLGMRLSVANTYDTSHRYDYSYDAQGRLLFTEEWFAPQGFGGGPLELTATSSYKYNAQGKLDSIIKKTIFNGLWRDYLIIKHFYDSNGFKIHELETRRMTNDSLRLFEERFYTYDVQDRLATLRMEKSHNLNPPHPSVIWEETYFYTAHSILVDSIHQRIEENGQLRQNLIVNNRLANDSLAEVLTYMGSPGNWSLVERLQYNYALTTSVSTLTPLEVNLFPNPLTDVLNIQLPGTEQAQGQIFDLNGRFVSAFEVQEGIAVLHLGHLPAGTYFLQLHAGGKSSFARFVKH